MNYIYTNKSNGRRFFLNPEINMGDKVCLTDMATCEDKFLSPKTLKRNYTKDIWEEEVAEVVAFTGMKLGMFKLFYFNGVWMVWTKSRKCLEFDADGNQTNAKNPKFANKIQISYGFSEMALNWALN